MTGNTTDTWSPEMVYQPLLEHHVTAMLAVDGALVLSCRCGKVVTGRGVTSTLQRWDQHLADVR